MYARHTFQADVQIISLKLFVIVFAFIFDRVTRYAIPIPPLRF